MKFARSNDEESRKTNQTHSRSGEAFFKLQLKKLITIQYIIPNESQRGKMAQIKWIKVHKSQISKYFPGNTAL